MRPARFASLRLLVIAAAALALPALGCGGGTTGGTDDTACSNGTDDDGDTLIDLDDPGCANANDDDENNVVKPQCSDGLDNDDDGKVDYPADPGCLNSNQNSELDDCPSGPNCPACSNAADDDLDGKTDADDPGCSNARDTSEEEFNATACGPRVVVTPLPATGKTTGTLELAASHLISAGNCGGLGAELAYELTVTEPMVIVASTAVAGTTVDTVVYVRGADCASNSELTCNNDASSSATGSTVQASLQPGTYYIIVDGNTNMSAGTFNLEVTRFKGQGSACDAAIAGDCAPGFFCRALPGQASTTCQPPRCGDGVDDESGTLDTKVDYPLDPGCTSITDDSEDDDCPSGPNCPACGNDADDDLDSKKDYPADPTCVSASGLSESCDSPEPIGTITAASTSGTTATATNDRDPACADTPSGPDLLYSIDLPQLDSLSIATPNSFDTVIELLDASCGTPLACVDFLPLTRSNVAAGRYYLSVDGYFDDSLGAFTVSVTGAIANGGRCDGPLATAGALTCATGTACDGTVCRGTKQCNDGLNNGDGDTLTDFPADPGCSAPADDSEADDCPSGPNCPVCANGADDDLDSKTDYPADPSCGAASGTSESCAAAEPLQTISTKVTSSTTAGAQNDLSPTCGSTTNTAADVTFSLELPQLKSLTIVTDASFDAVTALLDTTCGGAALACEDTADIVRGATAAGTYFVVVDGYSTASGTFDLTVSGEIATGGGCEGALAQAGALTCAPGFACSGAPGGRTCQLAACNDGISNGDGDTKVDFPADPGCTSSNDDDEADDCPSGPNCPVCGNGDDDDLDGKTDYPADTSCTSASATSESCTTTEPILELTTPITTGTTVGGTNDVGPACGSSTNTAPDRVYGLDLPSLTSLAIVTSPSFDAVTALYDSSCGGTALACQDSSDITRAATPAGRYFVVVDGWGSGSGTYSLTVSGVIATGASCESSLVQAGGLRCADGFACKGNPGGRVCQLAACNDGISNGDGDALVDYPADPGCTASDDDDEADDCPSGPNCPACSNGADDDLDGQKDYPADTGCVAASGRSEACATSEAIIPLTMGVTTGTTINANDDAHPSCTATAGSGPDLLFELDLPALDSLTIDDTLNETTGGFDSSFQLFKSACGGTALTCTDNGPTTVTTLGAGLYYLILDGYFADELGNYSLSVAGKIAAGGRCDGALALSGALTCKTGTTCTAGTCQ